MRITKIVAFSVALVLPSAAFSADADFDPLAPVTNINDHPTAKYCIHAHKDSSSRGLDVYCSLFETMHEQDLIGKRLVAKNGLAFEIHPVNDKEARKFGRRKERGLSGNDIEYQERYFALLVMDASGMTEDARSAFKYTYSPAFVSALDFDFDEGSLKKWVKSGGSSRLCVGRCRG